MASSTLTSRRHPFVQRCRRIATGRGGPGHVLLDGLRLIGDAVEAGVSIEGILADDRAVAEVTALTRPRGITLHLATSDVINAASPVRSPSGVVAIASWAPRPAIELLDASGGQFIGLVGVQDPGNVGNIIRSADALGASGVLALDGTADPGNWKALRGAMGSTFRIPVGTGSARATLDHARKRGIRVAATVAAGGLMPDEDAVSAPLLVLIGSEGTGLPSDIVDAADARFTLPMRSRVNSLNAATTAALLLWEMARGRRASQESPA